MMEMQLSSPPKDPFDSSFEPEVEKEVDDEIHERDDVLIILVACESARA